MIRKYLCRKGEPTYGFDKDFAKVVYDSCKIFQHRDFDEYFFNLCGTIVYTDRWEYVVTENGKITASMAFHREFDMHVGDCLSVLVALSTGDSRMFGGYKWLYQVAKELKIPFICITRETKPFNYEMVYKRVKI